MKVIFVVPFSSSWSLSLLFLSYHVVGCSFFLIIGSLPLIFTVSGVDAQQQQNNTVNTAITTTIIPEITTTTTTSAPSVDGTKFVPAIDPNKVIPGSFVLRFNSKIYDLNIPGSDDLSPDIANSPVHLAYYSLITSIPECNSTNNTSDDDGQLCRNAYIWGGAYDRVKSCSFRLDYNNNNVATMNPTTGNRKASSSYSDVDVSKDYLLSLFLQSDLVELVEEDQQVEAFENQVNPTWGLDRIDQTNLPLDNTYRYDHTGKGITAYIIDTGIRETHTEFDNNDRAVCEYSAIEDEFCYDDHGHGTHVAGTIGGKTYGVAKEIQLRGVKVLGSDGVGSTSKTMQGVNYVFEQCVDNRLKCVVNMSLGSTASASLDAAVQDLINAGIFVAAAAGNSDIDACFVSPSRVPQVVTVASTTEDDVRSSFSNWGPCVDVFAPGSNILSAWNTNDTATNVISGTSMSTPHTIGLAALYWSAQPNLTNLEISAQLLSDSTSNLVQDTKESANLLVNTQAMFTTTPDAVSTTSSSGSAFFSVSIVSELLVIVLSWSTASLLC